MQLLFLCFCSLLAPVKILHIDAKGLPDDAAAESVGRQAAKAVSASANVEQSESSDMFVDDGFGDALTKALREAPSPREVADYPPNFHYLDPDILGNPDACDRDYSIACPQQFVVRELVEGGFSCMPAASYRGSCHEVVTFKNDADDAEVKRAFALRCKTNWNCRDCPRDLRVPCPLKFKLNDKQLCVPTEEYHGPCGNPVSFWMHNAAMISNWSARCMAFFPCVEPSDDNQVTSASLGKAASVQRVLPQ